MRKLILASFLIACICAYPQKQNSEVAIKSVEYRNIPKIFGIEEPLVIDLPIIEEDILNFVEHLEDNLQDTIANINEYADKILKNIRILMISSNLDPMAMPDLHSGFNYTLIITYHGELDLTSGSIHYLSTIHRNGDVIVSYSTDNKYLLVTVPLAFDELSFTYDYSAKIMGLGPKGGIEGKVNGIAVDVNIGFNSSSLVAALDYFNIKNAGHISFHFIGNPLIDWLLNLLTEVVTTLLKGVIVFIIENVVRGGIQTIVDIINDVINNIINPTTVVPTVVNFFNP